MDDDTGQEAALFKLLLDLPNRVPLPRPTDISTKDDFVVGDRAVARLVTRLGPMRGVLDLTAAEANGDDRVHVSRTCVFDRRAEPSADGPDVECQGAFASVLAIAGTMETGS
jgi:hypothetical protein